MHKGNNVVATAVRFMPHFNKCLNRAFYARTTHEMQLWVEMIIRVFCIFPGIRHGLKFKTTVQLTHIHHSPYRYSLNALLNKENFRGLT